MKTTRRQLLCIGSAILLTGVIAAIGPDISAEEPKVRIEWVQWWNEKKNPTIIISLWATPPTQRYRYLLGARGIHFNEYNEESVDAAIKSILTQAQQNYHNEPWFEEAYQQATDKSIDFYLE